MNRSEITFTPDGDGFAVYRRSPLTGEMNRMVLPITQEQINRFQTRDALIQDIFPDLDGDQREFLLTGYTPEDWGKIFGQSHARNADVY